MKPRTPILVLDGESFLTRKVVRSLAQAGRWQIHVLEKRSGDRRPCIEWSRHVASIHSVVMDLADSDYLEAVVRVARQTGAEVLLPVEETSVHFCIRNRAVLEEWVHLVPLPRADVYATAINKVFLATFMAREGIVHPRSLEVASSKSVRFPALIKPARSSGGRGIVQVSSSAELEVELEKRSVMSRDYLIQEYVSGFDMGCSILAREGRIEAWTIQRGLSGASAFSPCSELRFEWNPEVLAVVKKLVAALGWSGVANIDLRIDAKTGRPLILEVNGRFWATLLGSTAAGVNFPDLACRLACGEALPCCEPKTGYFTEASAISRNLIGRHLQGLQLGWRELAILALDPMPELACWWSARQVSRREVVAGDLPVPARA